MTQTPPPHQPPPYQPPSPYQQYPGMPRRRPGGLTALAVINFVFAGLGIIGIFSMFAVLAVIKKGGSGLFPRGMKMPPLPSEEVIYLSMLLGLVAAVLLIVSGVGYIKMSKVAGYVFGNIYAVVAITNNVIGIVGNPQAMVGVAILGVIIGLAYPVVTLILLNTVFRKYFT